MFENLVNLHVRKIRVERGHVRGNPRDLQGRRTSECSQGSQHARSSYSVAPSNYGTVYRLDNGHADLSVMKWGLIPPSARGSPIAPSQHYKTFNCRQDTLASGSGVWSRVRDRQRCLVLCQGYYEWRPADPARGARGKKIPYYVKRKYGHALTLAGLWSCVPSPKVMPEPLLSYTVITIEAAPDMQWLHSRIPVIVDPLSVDKQDLDAWLDASQPWSTRLLRLLTSYPAHSLECYAVSPSVGKVANDYPALIQHFKHVGIAAMLGSTRSDPQHTVTDPSHSYQQSKDPARKKVKLDKFQTRLRLEAVTKRPQ